MLTIGMALSMTVAAGPQPSPPPAHEYVEVTVTRVPERPDEVPASVTVVTDAELRDRGARDLRDALAFVQGVDISPGGDQGPAAAVPEFWGLREFDAFLLVVDGVPWGGAFNPALATLGARGHASRSVGLSRELRQLCRRRHGVGGYMGGLRLRAERGRGAARLPG